MNLKANVKYGGTHSCFMIYKDSPGVYHAHLVYFDGDQNLSPPEKITLIRGMRKWTGSCEDSTLLNELGKIIEEHFSELHDSKNS
jgi:hypothetical protein